MRGGRSNKPYTRPSGNPDAPGSWKHDLHQSTNPSSSLADRLSGSSRGSNSNSGSSLLSRISGGQGKELLPQGKNHSNKGKELFGFGTTPPVNGNNANAGVELLGGNTRGRNGAGTGPGPTRTPRGFQAQAGQRSLAQNGINAALGIDGRERRRELMSRNSQRENSRQGGSGVSILGAGNKSLVVRVSNLAQGTTAEDVVSAFAPVQFINATVSSSSTANLVSVDLELSPENKRDAEGLIDKYDGQIADGNKLSVSIVRQPSLGERMQGQTKVQAQGRSQELITPSSGKMYSDTILQSDPRARIQTVAEQEEEARNRQRADVWQINGGGSRNGGGGGGRSLASRLGGGGGGYRGSGGRGGMMID